MLASLAVGHSHRVGKEFDSNITYKISMNKKHLTI